MMRHLRSLRGLGISSWIDSQIAPGQRWESEIKRALSEAKVAVCLVSPSFVDSDFITRVELPALLKAEMDRGLRVYPVFVHFVHEVILRPMGLLEFQGINRPEDPIARWIPARKNLECRGVLSKWLVS
jgi:hypothetical protein